MSTLSPPPAAVRQLFLAALLAGILAGCAAPRVMYGGPVKLKSESPPGLVLEGQDKRPVECYPDRGDSFADITAGQWAVVEGTKSHDGELAVGVRECHVIAVSTMEPAPGIPGLELRHRVPQPVSGKGPDADKTPEK